MQARKCECNMSMMQWLASTGSVADVPYARSAECPACATAGTPFRAAGNSCFEGHGAATSRTVMPAAHSVPDPARIAKPVLQP